MISQELQERIDETRARHEFLTFLILQENDEWKCGIVQNSSNRFITFYDLARIRDEKAQARFFVHADRWWWESGMALPIDAFIGRPFDEFQDALTTISRKTLQVEPIGPAYSITDHYLKRVKKRRIDLVNRRVDDR